MKNTTPPKQSGLTQTPPEKRDGDTFFDQWLIASGDALRSLVTLVEADLLAYESRRKVRKRARKLDAARKLSKAVEIVVCNLARESSLPARQHE